MSPLFRSAQRHRVSTFAAIAVAAAALTALPAGAQPTPMGTTAANGGAASAKLNRTDESLLRNIAQANLAEVASGKLALEKSQNEQVKKFAQMMVDDHSKALSDVEQLAQAKNVKLPTEPDMKHKAVMVEFKALSGATFDKRYMKQAGVGDHKATDDLLKRTQTKAKDADLKALAGKMLPVVEGHLKHAMDMASM